MTSSVPKFASFRPKPKSEKPTPEQKRSATPPPARKPKTDPAPSSSRPYVSDRRGDADIARYGSINHYDVPRYRRTGRGFVLGSSLDQRIDHHLSSDKHVTLTPSVRQRQERLLTDKRSARQQHVRYRLSRIEVKRPGPLDDFVPVTGLQGNKQDDSDIENVSEMKPEYRDIHDKPGPPELPEDPELVLEELDTEEVSTDIRRRNAELARLTKEHPEDSEVWLRFVEHQEAMAKYNESTAEGPGDLLRRQLADVRITILDDALKKVKSEDGQIALLTYRLSEGERSWEASKATIEWGKAINKYTQHAVLWLRYLDYVQSNMTHFKYESCRELFLQALAALKSSEDYDTSSVCHIFLRMTCMMQQAGYQEIALAIWQMVLEHTISGPGEGQKGSSSFEEFWDSEVPRIGELGAKGWKGSSRDADPPEGPSSLFDHTVDGPWYLKFKSQEGEALKTLRYPGRAMDVVGEDDAFHTIFYSDIAPYIGLLSAQVPRSMILNAFLCFCGLPSAPSIDKELSPWWSDRFLQHAGTWSTLNVPKTDNAIASTLSALSAAPVQSFQMTRALMFQQRFNLSDIRLDPAFIQRILKLNSASSPDEEDVGVYLLAFETRHFPEAAPRTARKLIKARPMSQRLYNAYGHVEEALGNCEKADKVFSAALSMQDSKSLLGTLDSLELFETWVWSAIDRRKYLEAMFRLASPEGAISQTVQPTLPPDEASLHRIETLLREVCEESLLGQSYRTAVISTSLLASLDYLSHSRDLEHAMTRHCHLSNWFASHKLDTSSYAELHAQSIARLLRHHITYTSLVKPTLIRSILKLHVTRFPSNTILLALYTANEARFSIDDRVRNIMSQTVVQSAESTSIAEFSFAIQYETMRNDIGASTAHSIRALYKRATATQASGTHCTAIWTSFLLFEIAQLQEAFKKGRGKTPRIDGKRRTWETRVDDAANRVKDTFYQGMSHVPWCKDFMMMAFTHCEHVFGSEELWKVYRVMQEKELRLYVEIDELAAFES